MSWPWWLIYNLSVSGSVIYVGPFGTTPLFRNYRACNKLKIKYFFNARIKSNKISSFNIYRKFGFMVDVVVMFGGVIGFVAGT